MTTKPERLGKQEFVALRGLPGMSGRLRRPRRWWGQRELLQEAGAWYGRYGDHPRPTKRSPHLRAEPTDVEFL